MAMSEAARQARRAYQKEWRKKNPDKVRAALDRYWEKKGGELTAKRSGDETNGEESA